MTKSFSLYFYITFYITYQICNVTKSKTALQIPAGPLSNISKNNTSLITSHHYLYEHSTTNIRKGGKIIIVLLTKGGRLQSIETNVKR